MTKKNNNKKPSPATNNINATNKKAKKENTTQGTKSASTTTKPPAKKATTSTTTKKASPAAKTTIKKKPVAKRATKNTTAPTPSPKPKGKVGRPRTTPTDHEEYIEKSNTGGSMDPALVKLLEEEDEKEFKEAGFEIYNEDDDDDDRLIDTDDIRTDTPETTMQELIGDNLDLNNNTTPEETKKQSQKFVSKMRRFLHKGITKASRSTYFSSRNGVIKRGHGWTVLGLLELISSEESKDLTLSNTTLASTISAFKHHYFVTNLVKVPEHHQELMAKLLQGRRKEYPDTNRVTGAMNAKRTADFETYIRARMKIPDEEQRLSEEQGKECIDAAWMLYALALRVFQLQLLEPTSFYEHPVAGGKTELYVKVKAKGDERWAREFERKQVHPVYVETVKRMIAERVTNTKLFFDFHRIIPQFSQLVKDAAEHYGWPVHQRFSGTHVFRHGAAQDAFLEEGGNLALVQLRTGHLSKKAAQHYALSDAQREGITISRIKKKDERDKEDLLEANEDLIKKKIALAERKVKDQLKGVFKESNNINTVSVTRIINNHQGEDEDENNNNNNNNELILADEEDEEEQKINKQQPFQQHVTEVFTLSTAKKNTKEAKNLEKRRKWFEEVKTKEMNLGVDWKEAMDRPLLFFNQTFRKDYGALSGDGSYLILKAETLNKEGIKQDFERTIPKQHIHSDNMERVLTQSRRERYDEIRNIKQRHQQQNNNNNNNDDDAR
jgi:hypothetical protein